MKTRRARRTKRQPAAAPELIPDNWTDAQALAVYDFCAALQELVWRQYRDTLTDQILREQMPDQPGHQLDTRTRPLPFDDEPF